MIDAATYVSGPYTAGMLCDLGAEVTKIEPPGGDPLRRDGRTIGGLGVSYAHINRGKRVRTLDLKTAEGLRDFGTELSNADVLVTNWRSGVAEQLGLEAERVSASHPRLVWARITGFGPDGPMATAPAFDTVVQARTGLLFTQGTTDRPQIVKGFFVDKITAAYTAQTVLASLIARAGHGRGAVLDVSMLDALSYFNASDLLTERTLVADSDGSGVNRQLGAIRPVRTQDGWLLAAPVRGRHLRGMAVAAGHPEWIDRLRAAPDRPALTELMYELLDSVGPTDTTAHWIERLTKEEVPASAVLDIDAHLSDEQVAVNQTYTVVDDREWGPTRLARHPGRWRGQPRLDPGGLPHEH